MKIVHLSDIHWRGFKRHEEYTEIHEQLFKKLQTEIKPEAIVCTGDIFHTKTQGITPEIVEKLVWFFRRITGIAPLYLILGNHDGNLANETRQDIISPIVGAMNNEKIHLYKKSGVYEINNDFAFCVFSPFDKEGWESVVPKQEKINIALFHGAVIGCLADNETVLEKGEISLQFFSGYDFALLGDVHKRQFLDTRKTITNDFKPWIGYSGSVIQQNFGEEEEKGFLVWDIRSKNDWDVDFVALENKTPYLSIPWVNNVAETLKTVEEIRGNLQKGTRIRVISDQNISFFEKRHLQQELKENRGCSELVFDFEKLKNSFMEIRAGDVSIHKTSLRNDIKTLIKLYREYVHTHKIKLSEEQLLEGEKLIVTYVKKLNDQETDATARDSFWCIKSVEFDNLFRYGKDNKVDFTKLTGLVGIFGNNFLGKSSLISVLCYGLFNKSDREGLKSGELINRSKKDANCKIVISVDGTDYVINRKLVLKEGKEDKAAVTSLSFCRIDKDNNLVEVLNEESRNDTDKVIRKLIGTREDFMVTSLASQYAPNNFISLGPTSRKAIINRFHDIDIFEKLFKYANDDNSILVAKTSNYQSITWDLNILKAEKELSEKQSRLDELNDSISNYRTKTEELRLWVRQHTEQIEVAKKLKKQEEELSKELLNSRSKFNSLKSSLERKITERENVIKNIEVLKRELLELDFNDLEMKQKKVSELTTEVTNLNFKLESEETKLEGQKRSVNKLKLVPCQEQFPTCRYIKDSLSDSKTIASQQKLVENLNLSLCSLKQILDSLLKEKIEAKLHKHKQSAFDLEKQEKSLVLLSNTIELDKFQIANIESSIHEKEVVFSSLEKESGKESELFEKSKTLEVLTKQLSNLEDRRSNLLMGIGESKAKIDSLKSEQEKCRKILDKLKILGSVLDAFAKDGLPAMILQTQLPLINNELEKITSNLDFKITLETEVDSNTLDVFIENNGPKRVIESCSGAEMSMASLAIRVALTSLSSLPKTDILIVDESFGSLDETNIPKVLQFLEALKGYYKTIFIISHIPHIKESVESIIEIIDSGQESKVCV